MIERKNKDQSNYLNINMFSIAVETFLANIG